MADRASDVVAGPAGGEGGAAVVEPEGRPFGGSTAPAELDPSGPDATGRAVLAELAAALDPDRILTDPDTVRPYVHDEAEWAAHGTPLCVVRARSTAEVAATVAACARHRIPVVPRGAGTGLSGGANAVDGCVLLSTERMTAIREVSVGERLAVVEPGVVNDDLRAACAEQGLWYPPDPASAPWSTIGGNVATNAGGLCCVKYGVTRDYVLALEVVTAAGEVVRVGRRTAKGVAGYDLAGLMVGSEGTLGVITEITVKLRPARPDAPRTVVGFFESLADCGAAVAAVTEQGLQPSVFELVDRECLAAVNAWRHAGLPESAAALLLARTDLPEPAAGAEADAILAAFTAHGATEAMASTDETESEALFDARRMAYPALEQLGMGMLTEDVCVPRTRMASMLARIEEISHERGVRIATVAHAGDGNLHPLMLTPHDDPAARDRTRAAFDEIIAAALEHGGTVTGEHGVGLLKRDGMERELGPGVLAMQRAVKAALDPDGILNPGKAV
ncbi:FAD-linked oxidase C-terminal domain-containing protein [Pseudonocardia nematodicida]|uniref:FAD-linked oxidase C-terminal domain-containing protein n=1 Tax=Pseudonocardia nematodicida TaxID=1206997 RepID=A0ABV1KI04_9PSEU